MLKMDFEVTSLSLTQEADMVCIALYDAPLFSLLVYYLGSESITKIEQRSLLSILDHEAYQNILENASLA